MREAVQRLRRRARALLHRRTVERDMEDEMRLHLEMEAEELIHAGVPPEEAWRRARLAFGGVERFKEEARDGRGTRWLEDLARDVRHAARSLRRTPGVTLAAVASLTLAIAATTAVVGAVRTLLLPPSPVAAPERVVTVHERMRDGFVATDAGHHVYPYGRYLAYREHAGDVFDGVAGARLHAFSLRAEGGRARTLTGVVASDNYFAVLGVRPALGRTFATRRGAPPDVAPEVVVSHDFWRRDLGADSGAIGRTLYLDGRPLLVVGVAEPRFHGTLVGIVADVWVPMEAYRLPPPRRAGDSTAIHEPWLSIFGRLRPGLAVEAAERRLSLLAPRLARPGQEWMTVERVRLDPFVGLPAVARGGFAAFFGVLALTAALVLGIAATNVAGMLLARSIYRRRETAVRLSLGAPRRRVVRQVVLESVLLCLLGGAAGVLLTAAVVRLAPPSSRRSSSARASSSRSTCRCSSW